MITVMCFGTFDLLHHGHLSYLTQAKKHGDKLIVVIARDKTTKKFNKSPLFSEKERLKLVQNLKVVDEAVLGYHNNFFKIIKKKNPDVVCLGYDQKITKNKLHEKLRELSLHPKIIRMKPYKEEIYKSTKIKQKINNRKN